MKEQEEDEKEKLSERAAASVSSDLAREARRDDYKRASIHHFPALRFPQLRCLDPVKAET